MKQKKFFMLLLKSNQLHKKLNKSKGNQMKQDTQICFSGFNYSDFRDACYFTKRISTDISLSHVLSNFSAIGSQPLQKMF